MNVIVTINGNDYVLSIKEAQDMCKSIHEQLYIVPKENM